MTLKDINNKMNEKKICYTKILKIADWWTISPRGYNPP